MSAPTWEEMEAKRQEMITSFKDIAAAMTRCVAVIEDYARLSPSTLSTVAPSSLTTTTPKSSKPTKAAQAAAAKAASASTAAPAVSNGQTVQPTEAEEVALTPAQLKAKTKGEKKEKKEKKVKDPNAPKRPPSAYLLFQNDVREQIRNTNAGLPYKEILGLVSERWKTLPADQKRVYEEAYNDAQKVHNVQNEAYTKGLTAAADETAAALAAVAAHAKPTAESSDSSDSDSSTDSDDDTPPKTIAPSAMQAPPVTLAQVSLKKDKKRKDETPVSDKKKKKSKD